MATGAEFVPGKALTALRERSVDPRPVLDAIGATLVSAAKRAFMEQKRGSVAWRPRSVPNVAGIVRDLMEGRAPPMTRLAPRPALMDSGRLQMSIDHRITGQFTVEVGTMLPYAALHQYGGESTQPWSKAGKERLRALLRTSPWSEHEDRLGWLLDDDVTSVTTKVPARPFLAITPQDKADIFDIIRRAWSGQLKSVSMAYKGAS